MLHQIEIFGKEIMMYDTMYLVGITGMFFICLFSRKKYKTPFLRALIYTIVTFVFGVAGAKIMGNIYNVCMALVSGGEYDPNSGVCIFGALMFLPVFMAVLALVSGEKYRKLMDYMTPGIFLILGCAKFGCLLGGCCYGLADVNGVYNHNLDYTVFPVQLYESLCTSAVVAILIVIMLLRKNNTPKIRYGSLYPIGTIVYCCVRFFWENYRYYEYEYDREFFFGLTYWQCWAIIAVIVSVIWLVILYTDKKYAECELMHNKYLLKEKTNRLTDEVNSRVASSFDKKRKKHADKAKEHAKKAKELKRK